MQWGSREPLLNLRTRTHFMLPSGLFSCTCTEKHKSCYALGTPLALAHTHTLPLKFAQNASCYALGSPLAIAEQEHVLKPLHVFDSHFSNGMPNRTKAGNSCSQKLLSETLRGIEWPECVQKISEASLQKCKESRTFSLTQTQHRFLWACNLYLA